MTINNYSLLVISDAYPVLVKPSLWYQPELAPLPTVGQGPRFRDLSSYSLVSPGLADLETEA